MRETHRKTENVWKIGISVEKRKNALVKRGGTTGIPLMVMNSKDVKRFEKACVSKELWNDVVHTKKIRLWKLPERESEEY